MDPNNRKAERKRFTTRKVWKRKKNGLFGWGVRKERIIDVSDTAMEVSSMELKLICKN